MWELLTARMCFKDIFSPRAKLLFLSLPADAPIADLEKEMAKGIFESQWKSVTYPHQVLHAHKYHPAFLPAQIRGVQPRCTFQDQLLTSVPHSCDAVVQTQLLAGLNISWGMAPLSSLECAVEGTYSPSADLALLPTSALLNTALVVLLYLLNHLKLHSLDRTMSKFCFRKNRGMKTFPLMNL